MNYEVYGGFEIPRKPNKRSVVDARDRNELWRKVHEAKDYLQCALGCYIFALRKRGGGIVPWYVGKTCRQGFIRECFEPHKLVYFNEVVAGEAGVPLLYLIARVTPGGKFTKSFPARESDYLETLLIGMALQRNPSLKNVTRTKLLKELHVPGLVNSRANPRKGPVADLMAMFAR